MYSVCPQRLDIPSSNSNTPNANKCYIWITVVGESLPFLRGYGLELEGARQKF